MKKKTNRNIPLDGLRIIGLLAIVLAHVDPPAWLFQLRNFDVPLMVFVSGASYGLSSGRSKKYMSYLIKRIERLVFPTWILLSIYFLSFFVISLLSGSHFPFSPATIFSSYTMQSGIGYVWIIRVFVLVALVMPFLLRLFSASHKYFLIFLLFSYILYELLYSVYTGVAFFKDNALVASLIQDYLFYLVPFGIVAGFGLLFQKASKRLRFGFLVGFVLLFLVEQVLFHGWKINTQMAKYPPRSYYLSYALAMTILLMFLSETKLFISIFRTRFFQFFAQSTLWIYLWHILFLGLWERKIFYVPFGYHWYLVEYVFVIFWAVLFTYLQKKIIKKCVAHPSLSPFLGSLLRESFLK